jgi:hypothetical protein
VKFQDFELGAAPPTSSAMRRGVLWCLNTARVAVNNPSALHLLFVRPPCDLTFWLSRGPRRDPPSSGHSNGHRSGYAARHLNQADETKSKLCYMGHATTENRHGLAVAGMVTHANIDSDGPGIVASGMLLFLERLRDLAVI